ncbi:Alpha-catulin Alpha-catenin-related protein [Triplophysa tibetana]|uniref:Alpha-catulin n=1 Tax=Triplophysa tibetana TaxID=1572043 RepID=A0A5A9NL68_9TELE|nr:Alpha-catulin Alpha-catenin-related protein [Triplophysa tibetana]
MASSPCGSGGGGNFDCGLEIQTRSVEQTLIPLVSQITTLINHKDKLKKTEKTLRAIQRVGQAVSVAVSRFVAVGEAIAAENEDLKDEMGLACFEARRAGTAIAQLTDVSGPEQCDGDGRNTVFSDRTGMVKAARMLLSSVTKVLVLADCIVIKQIISSRNKVLVTLEQLERVSTFQEFVQIFSQFGNEMVEFAHLTGDRQNDLKDEKKRSRMAAARAVLEKCTMMLLTASKTCLRHPDCDSARMNKEAVFQRMRLALEQVIEIVTDARSSGEAKTPPGSINAGIKDFKVKVEGLRDSLFCVSCEALLAQLEALVEKTEDFTDSAYTSHEQRETIIQLCQATRRETRQLINTWRQAQSLKASEATEEMELSILKTCQSVRDLRRELHKVAVGRASDLLKLHSDHLVLQALKASGGDGNLEAVADYAGTLSEHKEQLLETCRLLCHISGSEPLEITCIHAEETFRVIGPQIISAAQTLALHPTSKIAKENLDVFCEAWESQLCDMAILLKEINDVFEGRRGDKKSYLSLPRPGKHSGNLKTIKAAKLDAEEQTTIAKLGLELCLHTSDLDSEVERWEEQDHEIVRLSQIISSMAYSMYLFTRGEGLLKTTLDLFHQAEVLSDQGLKLCSILRSLSTQLLDEDKILIISETEKLAASCQQLQICAKTPVQGKSAIFQKVDSCIQNTKGILTVVVFLLPTCNKILRKFKSDRSVLGSPQHWRDKQLNTPVSEESLNGKGSNGFGLKSLEQHMANLTFLESK